MSRLGKKVVLYLVKRQKYGLDDSSRRLLDLMLQGYGSDEIAQLEGISKEALRMRRHRRWHRRQEARRGRIGRRRHDRTAFQRQKC
jgi:hypothetical protein